MIRPFSPYSHCRLLVGALLATFLSVDGAAADNVWTGAVDNNWNTPGNWSLNRVPSNPSPDGFDDAVVNILTNFPVIGTNTVANPRDTKVGMGAGTNGRVDHRAGTHSTSAANWTFVGYDGGTGTYNLADTATVGPGITGFGTGSGTLNFGGRFYVGDQVGGMGTLNINTTGAVNQTEAVNDRGFYIGDRGGTGVVNLQNGTVRDHETYVGINGKGTLNISGGRWDTNHWSVVGGTATADGTVNMTGGTWNQNHTDWLSIGQEGKGVFNMSGGVLNDQSVVDTSARGTNKGNVVVGRWTGSGAGGNGTWNLSGTAMARVRSLLLGDQANTTGVVSIKDTAAIVSQDHDLFLGNAGKGTVNLDGGSAAFNQGWVFIGQAASGNGTLNVNSGAISSNRYYIGQAGTGTVNVAGGALTANDFILLGEGASGAGTLNVTSGTATTRAITIGAAGRGTFTQSGGMINMIGDLAVGTGASSGNTATINGNGLLNVEGNLLVGANGILTQSGGTVTVSGLVKADNPNPAIGSYNLSGGVLNVNGSLNTTGGLFNFTGGRISRSSAGAINITGDLILGDEAAGLKLGTDKTFSITGKLNNTAGITFDVDGMTIPAWDGAGADTGSFLLGLSAQTLALFDPATTNVLGLNNLAGASFISEQIGEAGTYGDRSVFWVQDNAGQVTLNYNVVPEPATISLLALVSGAALIRRRRQERM
jgi:T5SS/PEP-CTERM-associated repeat protein